MKMTVKLMLWCALLCHALFCTAQETSLTTDGIAAQAEVMPTIKSKDAAQAQSVAPLNLDTDSISKQISTEHDANNKSQLLTVAPSPFATVFTNAENGPHFSGMVEVGIGKGVGRQSGTRGMRAECDGVPSNGGSLATLPLHSCPTN